MERKKLFSLVLGGFVFVLGVACQVRGQKTQYNATLNTLGSRKANSNKVSLLQFEKLSHHFELIELDSKNILLIDSTERPSMVINLEKQTVSGTTGCNSYMGQVEVIQEGEIRFKELATTLRACREGNPERDFIQALYAVRKYSLAEGSVDTLCLLTPEGKVLMRLCKK